MVEAKDRDRRNLFSQYIELQDFLMKPLRPLIHLIGFQQQTHWTILQLTLEAPHVKESKNYRQFDVHSYDFYDISSSQNVSSLPLIYSQTSKGDKLRMNSGSPELGFLRHSFFKSLQVFKPAVTILVFDWQN
jgi:hypothetical protein